MNRSTSQLGCILSVIAIAVLLMTPSSSSAASVPPSLQPPTHDGVTVVAEGTMLSIYVTNSHDQSQRQAAQVPMDKAPLILSDFVALSPDGRSVAYVTMDNPFTRANTEIWIATTDGSGTRRIAQFSEGFWLVAPVWSPDSQRLAFVMERPAPDPEQRLELWVMNRDGSNQQLLLHGAPLVPDVFIYYSRALSWSVDSTQLVINNQASTTPMISTINVADRTLIQRSAEKVSESAVQAAAVDATLPCGVQLWHQNNYSDVMQTCNNSIANVGCAITSAAMVLKYYGVNTDPPALSRCMGNCACPICNWGTVASSCSEGKVAWVGAPGFSYSTIDGDLAAGRPVIAYLTRSGNTHFVVVTGGGGQTPGGYSINDPYRYSSLRQTLSPYTSEGWGLSGLRRYSGTPSCSDNDGGDISYGQSRSGTINPAGDSDDYYFNATSGDIVEIRQRSNSSSLDSYLRLYSPSGTLIAYNDDSEGTVNSFIRLTIGTSGRYRMRAAAYGSSTGAYTLGLTRIQVQCTQDCQGENRWISFGQTLYETINPATDRDTYYFSGTAGRVISIRMNRTDGSLDSFVELWNPNNVRVATNDDGGGDRNSWLIYTLPSSGTYRISAYSFGNTTTGSYSIKLESITGGGGSGNLARGKSVAVSSVEFSGVEGWRATDGSLSTRWSSRFSDPQWIYVDLGQNRYFNQVVLKWEAAYGRSFGIYYQSSSMCSSCWNNVYWTNSGAGGTNTLNFGRVSARYVLMYGAARGTSWGYSLWEFEVYDTTTTTIPLVPPDDPDKGENTAPLLAPLPPTEGDKDVVLNGDGEYGQEEMPLAGGEPASVNEERRDLQTVAAYIMSPDNDGLYKLYTPVGNVRFEGLASSQMGGNAIPIVAYQWRSDRQGEIGTEAAFTLPVSALLPGVHTIYFKAQNELGTWSEEVSVTLNVEWTHRVRLPIILR